MMIEYLEFALQRRGRPRAHHLHRHRAAALVPRGNTRTTRQARPRGRKPARARRTTSSTTCPDGGEARRQRLGADFHLPQGGSSYVIGNLIQKGPMAENKYRIVLYKGEGGTNSPTCACSSPQHLRQRRGAPAAVFVEAKAGIEVNVYNNLFVGPAPRSRPRPQHQDRRPRQPQTEDAGSVDRLATITTCWTARLIDGARARRPADPDSQYVHPSQTEDLAWSSAVRSTSAPTSPASTRTPPATNRPRFDHRRLDHRRRFDQHRARPGDDRRPDLRFAPPPAAHHGTTLLHRRRWISDGDTGTTGPASTTEGNPARPTRPAATPPPTAPSNT